MANWLSFRHLSAWDFPDYGGFAYDRISDHEIAVALNDRRTTSRTSISIDWEDDDWLFRQEHLSFLEKHAARIAALITDLRNGHRLKRAIEIDTFSNGYCASCVPNGHHRIRALQYLGFEAGPFDLSGLLDPLERLVKQASVNIDKIHGKMAPYIEPHLFRLDEDDVVISKKWLEKHASRHVQGDHRNHAP